jgi:hemolysin activation/secretion protein
MSLKAVFLMFNLNHSLQRFVPTRRHCQVLLGCILLSPMASLHAQKTVLPEALAQEPMAQATGATAKFKISDFDIQGDNPLSAQESRKILAPFVVTDATLITLQKATATYEAALKVRGYLLHRVSLPPQNLGGRVTLIIVKFVIGKVTVQGNNHFTQGNILASVPELQAGVAPNFTTLAVQTAIGNENPGKQMQVSLKESEEADKIDVKLIVKESKPWNVSVGLSNTGSDATGQDRLTVVGNHSNILGRDHQFSAAYTTSIARTSDVKQLGLNYRIPLYAQGGVLGVSYTKSDVVGSFGEFNSTGAGQTYGINYSHYLAPVGGWRTYLSAALEQKRFNASQINGMVAPGQVDRKSQPLSLGYTAKVESDTAVWGFNTDLVMNLGNGADSDLTAYQAEDPRIGKANWRALRGGANYMSALSKGWLWGWRGQYQYTKNALISGEQFGIGGVTSVRGTGERPISGDKGMSLSMELTSPELKSGLRAIGFVEGGWVNNYNSVVNANKPESDQLVSLGLGMRYATGAYGLNLDWGRVVKGSVLPYTQGSSIPQDGDQKIHLNLNARF